MTKRTPSILAALLVSCTGLLQAGAILTTIEPAGSVQSLPGTITGWGFTLTPDSNYAISVIGSFLENETNPALGTYTDLIGVEGGPSAGLLLPTDQMWTESFSYDPIQGMGTGLGAYQVNALASLGQTDSGNIHVSYELYSEADSCPLCYVATESVDLPFTATVGADPVGAPEPGTMELMAGAGCIALGLRWRRLVRR